MVRNVGFADRVARAAGAALLGFLGVTTSVEGWLEIAFYALAAYLAVTAIVAHCLLYRSLGIDSRAHAGEYHSGPVE